MVSDHKRAVQTVKRLRVSLRLVKAKQKVSVSVDSMARWYAKSLQFSFMTGKSKTSKRTILTTFRAEVSACRDALDLAEYTRAMLCEVVTGGRV